MKNKLYTTLTTAFIAGGFLLSACGDNILDTQSPSSMDDKNIFSIYDLAIGTINNILGLDINWLMNPKTALIAVMIMTIWKDFGYAVVMYLAGLYSLPSDALEAAKVDGATSWQTFRYITFPLLKPMTLFVVITSIISYIQAYVQILIMTEGGPGTATYLASYIIYDEAFVKYNFGYASALSFVLFVITAVLTWLSFRVSGNQE